MDKSHRFALISLAFTLTFGVYHLVFGIATRSWWFLTLGSYYLLLGILRVIVLREKANDGFVTRFTGWMLMVLSLPLVGTVILSVVRDRGHRLPMIIMIAMAAYAFTRITLATVHLIRSRRSTSKKLAVLRSISFSDALVSIFALQRSMLVSFEGMNAAERMILNASFGSAVCVLVFLLGLPLVRSKNRG